ncbi:unnamed protein product [Lepeophtheirus salmonis]|uniref:(salmon louse) hypothetical protein n=1 Tax=Lepeophtheirus salmonis TaxID=72036 RepID=A0A7R8HE41_LEPSM|nr:unnamed protein product [Lepeophtheirus salmonis]CAF3041583.1 unnamed protein product [Lepeophtheirus salmonis]
MLVLGLVCQFIFLVLVHGEQHNECIRKNMLVDKEVVHRVNIYETLPDCHEHCYNDNNCNHFDYGFYSKRCRIFNEKRDELTFIENLDHVTGPKTCSDTVHTNIHSKGKEILISENYFREDLTITKCRYKCLNDISCKAWTHFDDQCYLYSYPSTLMIFGSRDQILQYFME